MKNRKSILTYILAAVAILVTSASSSPATPARTYHGTLTGGTFFCDGNPVPLFTVTGNWNVNIDPRDAGPVHPQRLLRWQPSPVVRVQRADAGLIVRRRLRVLGVGDSANGDARHEYDSRNVLLACRTRRRLPARASLRLADVLRTSQVGPDASRVSASHLASTRCDA